MNESEFHTVAVEVDTEPTWVKLVFTGTKEELLFALHISPEKAYTLAQRLTIAAMKVEDQ